MANKTFEFEIEDTAFATSPGVLEEKKILFLPKKDISVIGGGPGGWTLMRCPIRVSCNLA